MAQDRAWRGIQTGTVSSETHSIHGSADTNGGIPTSWSAVTRHRFFPRRLVAVSRLPKGPNTRTAGRGSARPTSRPGGESCDESQHSKGVWGLPFFICATTMRFRARPTRLGTTPHPAFGHPPPESPLFGVPALAGPLSVVGHSGDRLKPGLQAGVRPGSGARSAKSVSAYSLPIGWGEGRGEGNPGSKLYITMTTSRPPLANLSP